MRVLHIITGLGDGGAQSVLFRLCSNDRAYRHIVISMTDAGKYGPLFAECGIEVFALQMKKGAFPFGSAFRLARLLRRLKPDVIQTWMYHADFFGGLVARLSGFHSIVWGIRHSNLEPGKSSNLTFLIARLSALVSGWMPTRIVVCARRAMDIHEGLGYCKRKMRFIPNGFDLNKFKPVANSRKALSDVTRSVADKPLIATIGRYDPQKDHANLLEALAILSSRRVAIQCLLVGTAVDFDNDELARLIQYHELGDSVILMGAREDIPVILSAIDLHVLPSAYGEGFPNVVAESMACQTPTVVTDVGDSAYIVGETGWVVPPSDAAALAEAIQIALAELNTPAWQQRCEAARARIEEKFSIEHMIAGYHQTWDEALQEVSRARLF